MQNSRYDVYLAGGYPIGSGVAFGDSRLLSNDWREKTGERWTVEGVQAMLQVPALFLNDRWEKFLAFASSRSRRGDTSDIRQSRERVTP